MPSAFIPTLQDGRQRMRTVNGLGSNLLNREQEELARIARCRQNRMYYDGTQFDDENTAWRDAQVPPWPEGKPIPEHERLHNYATQIAECVNFIANQLTDGFEFVADADQVQQVIDRCIDATDLLKNGSDEEIAFDDIMVEGGQTGDVPYEVLWDPIEETCYLEFWQAEEIEFDVPSGSWVKQVTRKQVITVEDTDAAGNPIEKQVQETVIYDLADVLEEGGGEELATHRECRRRVWWDDNPAEEPRHTDYLGMPIIPWGVLRVDKRGIKGFRGDPLITRQATDNADRYNANEQTGYLIARYNSHGNIAVIGDQAFLKLEQDPLIGKDIADVIRFPGGTGVFPIALPTDTQMIEHTRKVTADAMYASFGLTRVEPDTLSSLGVVSGYGLEILNRKSEGTFRRIRRTFKTDCVTMINLVLDVTAYRQAAVLDPILADIFDNEPELEVPAGLLPPVQWWDIDPQAVFPDRTIEVRMGSGYIVDDVQVRDDFTAKLLSLEEALRQRGFSDDQIKQIKKELKAASDATTEAALPQAPPPPAAGEDGFVVPAGQTVDTAADVINGRPVPSGTQAGRATGSTART